MSFILIYARNCIIFVTMMYEFLLYFHSYDRWVIPIAGLVAIGLAIYGLRSKKPCGLAERISGLVFLISFDTQFLTGWLLYLFYSPITQVAFNNFGGAMKNTALRFYALEHMLLGVTGMVVLHIGNVISRRAKDDVKRRKTRIIYFSIVLFIILLTIPWPIREAIARPLFR